MQQPCARVLKHVIASDIPLSYPRGSNYGIAGEQLIQVV